MELEGLTCKPFNASLMGVIAGVSDYYKLPYSYPELYALSGHGFLINIHKILCPSGPYVWKGDWFYNLLKNIGLEVEDLGFFSKGSTPDEISNLEAVIKENLDKGLPCSTCNMDHQVIAGYDDDGLILLEQWGSCCTTPPHLSFSTWKEFGDELHACFYLFRQLPIKGKVTSIKECLVQGIKLLEDEGELTYPDYAMGIKAYDNWINALETNTAHPHGSWWNAVVWSESREMLGKFFLGLASDKIGDAELANKLANRYKAISEDLLKVSDKDMAGEEKLKIVKGVQVKEKEALDNLKRYIETF